MNRPVFVLTLLAVAGLGYLFGSRGPAGAPDVLSVSTALSSADSPAPEALMREPGDADQLATGRSIEAAPRNVLPFPVEGPIDTWEKKVARCQEIAIEIGPSRWMQDLYNDVYIGRVESAHYFMSQRGSASESDLALLDSMIQSLRGLEQEMRSIVSDEMYRVIEECDYPTQVKGGPPPAFSRDSYLSMRIPRLDGVGSMIECRKEKVPQIAEMLETSRQLYVEAEALAKRMGWQFDPEVAQFEEGAFGARRVTTRDGRPAGN
jgi:hypothetical protein